MFSHILNLNLELSPEQLLSNIMFVPFKIVDSKSKQLIQGNVNKWLSMPESTPEELGKKLQIIIHNVFMMDLWKDIYNESWPIDTDVLLWMVKTLRAHRTEPLTSEYAEQIKNKYPEILNSKEYVNEWKMNVTSLEYIAMESAKKSIESTDNTNIFNFALALAKYFIYISQLRVNVSAFNKFIEQDGFKSTLLTILKKQDGK